MSQVYRIAGGLLLLAALFITGVVLPVVAQDETRPIGITPGTPLPGRTPVPPTLTFDECYPPLPIESGQQIYIRNNVNIRAEPDGSSAIVWNTAYNNRPDDPDAVLVPLSIPAFVEEGPVCTRGYNWWRVDIVGVDGWVAEGRPDDIGYLLIIPGVDFSTACENPLPLAPGTTADLVLDARVRTEPDSEARVRTVAPAGTPVSIVAGPECVEDVNWYLVRVTVVDFTYEGWMAQGEDGALWLLPGDLPSTADGTLCGDPLPFGLGDRGWVDYRDDIPKTLRAAPGTDGLPLFTLVDGVPFIVIGGPVCRENLNWWQIQILSSRPVVGWVAEGSSGVGYWLTELDPEEEYRYAPRGE